MTKIFQIITKFFPFLKGITKRLRLELLLGLIIIFKEILIPLFLTAFSLLGASLLSMHLITTAGSYFFSLLAPYFGGLGTIGEYLGFIEFDKFVTLYISVYLSAFSLRLATRSRFANRRKISDLANN